MNFYKVTEVNKQTRIKQPHKEKAVTPPSHSSPLLPSSCCITFGPTFIFCHVLRRAELHFNVPYTAHIHNLSKLSLHEAVTEHPAEIWWCKFYAHRSHKQQHHVGGVLPSTVILLQFRPTQHKRARINL